MLLEFYEVKSQGFVRIYLRETPFTLEIKKVNNPSKKILYEFLVNLMSKASKK